MISDRMQRIGGHTMREAAAQGAKAPASTTGAQDAPGTSGHGASPTDRITRSDEAMHEPGEQKDAGVIDGLKGWRGLPSRVQSENGGSAGAPPSPADRFKAAQDDFGKAIGGLKPDQQKQVAEIHDLVKKKSEQARKTGMPYDPTEMFPCQVQGWAEDERENAPGDKGLEKVQQSSSNYIQSYRNYIVSKPEETDLKP